MAKEVYIYFISSNSVLCMCVCVWVCADSGFLASLISLMADENRSDERYIQYAFSHFADLFGSSSLKAHRIRLKAAKPSLSPLSQHVCCHAHSFCPLTSFFS